MHWLCCTQRWVHNQSAFARLSPAHWLCCTLEVGCILTIFSASTYLTCSCLERAKHTHKTGANYVKGVGCDGMDGGTAAAYRTVKAACVPMLWCGVAKHAGDVQAADFADMKLHAVMSKLLVCLWCGVAVHAGDVQAVGMGRRGLCHHSGCEGIHRCAWHVLRS